MEILNTTTVEAGLDIFDWIFGILLLSAGGFFLIYIIVDMISTYFDPASLIFIGLAVIMMVSGVLIFVFGGNKISYNKYDVIFNENVNLDEIGEKYIIRGHDGKIWHLEDKH